MHALFDSSVDTRTCAHSLLLMPRLSPPATLSIASCCCSCCCCAPATSKARVKAMTRTTTKLHLHIARRNEDNDDVRKASHKTSWQHEPHASGTHLPLPLAMPACNLCLANCGHKEIIVAIVGNVIDNSILCIIWVLCADASAL